MAKSSINISIKFAVGRVLNNDASDYLKVMTGSVWGPTYIRTSANGRSSFNFISYQGLNMKNTHCNNINVILEHFYDLCFLILDKTWDFFDSDGTLHHIFLNMSSSGDLGGGWMLWSMTNCQQSTADWSSFTPKTKMSSGRLCLRKRTPSKDPACAFMSFVSTLLASLRKHHIHVCQGLWLLHRHVRWNSCRGYDGLHWWRSHVYTAVWAPAPAVGADVQSCSIRFADELWHTSKGTYWFWTGFQNLDGLNSALSILKSCFF